LRATVIRVPRGNKNVNTYKLTLILFLETVGIMLVTRG
jgi:hypothetical protein